MKHATQIKASDVAVGMSFRYDGGTFVDGEYTQGEKVAVVTEVRVTKTGRINFSTTAGRWSNGAISPDTMIQK